MMDSSADRDHDNGGGNSFDEAEAAFFGRGGRGGGRGCCCCFPCWPSSSSAHQRIGGAAAGAEEKEDGPRWWRGAADAVLKVREWSELAAGPRWKTFIRRFGRGGAGGAGQRNFGAGRKLNYDALSYALNFDDGHGATPEPGGDHLYRDFSSRFAAPPTGSSAKSSMDLGGRNAPPLFFNPPPPIVQA